MKGTSQALIAALGFAALSFVFPLFSFLSAATIALVTLRQGFANGMLLFVVSSVAVYAMAFMSGVIEVHTPALLSLVVLFALMLLLGSLLRYSRSLSLVMQVSGGVGAVLIVGFHFVVENSTQWWHQHLNALFAEVLQHMALDQQAVFAQNLQDLAGIMTGFVTMAFILNALLCLFIARWWQALLYNPGGFRDEFHHLQLGRGTAVAALAIAILALLPAGILSLVCKDLLVIMLMFYVIQGIAVVHAVVAIKNLKSSWLIGLYIIVFVMSQLVAIAGYIDTWLDFRKRAAAKQI